MKISFGLGVRMPAACMSGQAVVSLCVRQNVSPERARYESTLRSLRRAGRRAQGSRSSGGAS